MPTYEESSQLWQHINEAAQLLVERHPHQFAYYNGRWWELVDSLTPGIKMWQQHGARDAVMDAIAALSELIPPTSNNARIRRHLTTRWGSGQIGAVAARLYAMNTGAGLPVHPCPTCGTATAPATAPEPQAP